MFPGAWGVCCRGALVLAIAITAAVENIRDFFFHAYRVAGVKRWFS